MLFIIARSMHERRPFTGSERDEQMGAIGILRRASFYCCTFDSPLILSCWNWTKRKQSKTKSRKTTCVWRSRYSYKTVRVRSPKLLAYEYEYHAKEVRHPLLGAIFGSKRVIDLPTLESGSKAKPKTKTNLLETRRT